MSWNKNTVSYSEINATITVLKELGQEYKLTILGTVPGHGSNDEYKSKYDIRKLEYKDTVIIEQMKRHFDCDSDDIIISFRFTGDDKIPEDWKLEITVGK